MISFGLNCCVFDTVPNHRIVSIMNEMVVNLHLNHQAQLGELKNESTNEIYQCPFEIFNFKKPCSIFGIFVGKFLHAGSTDILIFLDCLQPW